MTLRLWGPRLGLGVVSLVLAVSAASTAWAAPTAAEKQKAAQSFQLGAAAYAKGDFAGAAAAFEQAAMYAPHPSTLLNAAESWELARNPARAAQLADRVLETPSLEAPHRQAALKQLARVEKKIGTIVVRAPDRSRVEVDDREERSSTQESQSRLRVAVGAHKVKVTDEAGDAHTQSISVTAGETKEVDFLTPPPPKPEETRPSPLAEKAKTAGAPSENAGPPVASWVCFGAGAVATGAAVFFGVRTLNAKDDFDTNPSFAARDNFNQGVIATNVSIGAAVVGFAIGLVLWAVDSPPAVARSSAARIVRGSW